MDDDLIRKVLHSASDPTESDFASLLKQPFSLKMELEREDDLIATINAIKAEWLTNDAIYRVMVSSNNDPEIVAARELMRLSTEAASHAAAAMRAYRQRISGAPATSREWVKNLLDVSKCERYVAHQMPRIFAAKQILIDSI